MQGCGENEWKRWVAFVRGTTLGSIQGCSKVLSGDYLSKHDFFRMNFVCLSHSRFSNMTFQEALEAARLEEDPDDPSKTPTLMIEENMKILEDMRADFENMTS